MTVSISFLDSSDRPDVVYSSVNELSIVRGSYRHPILLIHLPPSVRRPPVEYLLSHIESIRFVDKDAL